MYFKNREERESLCQKAEVLALTKQRKNKIETFKKYFALSENKCPKYDTWENGFHCMRKWSVDILLQEYWS